MSKIRKKPKTYLNQGSMQARLFKRGQLIQSQEHLDHILSQVAPDIGAAWLEKFGPYLKFVPRQLQTTPQEQSA